MGFMDELKKLAKPYADDDDDFDEFDEGTAAPARNTSRAAEQDEPAQNTGRRTAGAAAAGADRNKVVNIHTTAQLQVVLVKPDRFNIRS